jgi:hypothetical protein
MWHGSRVLAVGTALLLAACAAIQQQKAQEARADESQFHNLRVLPQNITHDTLIATMRGFARGLGVKCNHCHVANPEGSKEEFDYPNDSKPEKKTARTMIRMVRTINVEFLSKVNSPGVPGQNVSCITCHRGHTVPEVAPQQLPPEAPPS